MCISTFVCLKVDVSEFLLRSLHFASSDSKMSKNSENNNIDYIEDDPKGTNLLTQHQYLALKTYTIKNE